MCGGTEDVEEWEAVADVFKSLKFTRMNMTLQLPDDLCTAAEQRAGVESKTLSSWFTDLLRRELRKPQPPPGSTTETGGRVSELPLPTTAMLGELYDEALADGDLPLMPRKQDTGRPQAFP